MLITTSIETGVALITLNRPHKRNAMTSAMAAELRAAIESTAEARVLVLAANGPAICAGADLAELDACEDFPKLLNDLSPVYLGDLPVPFIAAIQGPAVGLGLIIALQADLRFASTDATFEAPFAKRGLPAEYDTAERLVQLVGPGHAADLLLTARRVSAAEALSMGLVNHVYSPQDLLAKALEQARAIAQLSPVSLNAIKQQLASIRRVLH